MEGKGVSRALIIMGLLILGLVVAKTSTAYVICQTHLKQELYNYCVSNTDLSIKDCAKASGCTITESSHPHSNMLENSGAKIIEYCKLGCVSSVCDTITTNKNSGEVEEAMKRCVNACSEFCNKGAKTVLASAY